MTRRFFQIHLLTAVVGMLILSGLLWMNVRVRGIDVVQGIPLVLVVGGKEEVRGIRLYGSRYQFLGWPTVILDSAWNENAFSSGEESLIPWMPTVDHRNVEAIPRTTQLSGKTVLTLQDVQREAPELVSKITTVPLFESDFPSWKSRIDWKGFAINAAVAIAATLSVILAVEWFLRRSERAKV